MSLNIFASDIDIVVDLYRLNSDRPNSQFMLEAHNDAKRVYQSMPENEILEHPKGQEFLARFKKAQIYYDLKEKMNDCVNSRRNLKERLLDSAWSVDPCRVYLKYKFENIQSLSRDVDQVLLKNPYALENTKDILFHQAVLSTARTLWEYERLMGKKKSDKTRMNEICRELNDCKDPILANKVKMELNRFHQKFDNIPAPSLKEQVDEINNEISNINTALEEVKVGVDVGWVHAFGINSDDPDITDVTQIQHSLYHERYFRLASQGLGTLLMTKRLQNRVGNPRAINDVNESRKNGQTQYDYEPHRQIRVADMRGAFREAKSDIRKQLKELKEIHNVGIIDNLTFTDDQDRIDDLVQTYPAATGMAMMENPQVFAHVCKSIENIENSDERGETIRKVALYGGITVGTIAALTGVGAVFTAGIYSAAAAAGSATAATIAASATTVATVSFGIGAGIGVAETGYFSTQAFSAHQNYQEMRRSVLARTTDREGFYEANDELESFHQNFNDAIRAGFFTLLDFNGIRIARAVGRFTDTGKVSNLSRVLKEMLEAARQNPKVAKVLNVAKRLGDATAGKLLNVISDMKQSVRRRFLQNLGDLSEEQIEEVLRRITRCA